ncbi:transporter substrate-binding domain-containing protein [Colwellia sp. M166]|uniref:substrate-binding periplasmic protein n=1 Tax=Colwellia sp. M166 TaxID=2583805 RepID=UPI00211DE547|nr:transporter substrate-binding domain-containing protein [Colwellia sp. M166]UUO23674.1 transporter substrate-binding domain-containing protein [Colwellia sp. M166]
MRCFSMFFLLMLVSSIACGAEELDKQNIINIKVVTEDTFPLQYLENGKITGPATSLVEQVLLAAGVTYDIAVLPWARAYQLALTEANILIYSLAKTTARLNEFKWVGRIMALDYYLYGASDSEINLQTSLEALKQYQIGTVRDSAVEQYLRDNGFKKLTTVVQGKQNFFLFQQNRIELFPANKSSFQAICLQDAFNCHNLKPLYKLDISSIELYMAFSQLTDDAMVEKVRAGYKEVMKKRKNLHDIGIN